MIYHKTDPYYGLSLDDENTTFSTIAVSDPAFAPLYYPAFAWFQPSAQAAALRVVVDGNKTMERQYRTSRSFELFTNPQHVKGHKYPPRLHLHSRGDPRRLCFPPRL